ncbi:hypothetical protein [uncultured Tenacibaculum sp.]|uniref:hypothetical protein n=1 Tax=uncultured Tenacibaculum sp. TaxID=174713 RepID=UPI0026092652|nr:hypothetical protein [uncultured Tenacibaculum sp.]
MSTNNIDKEIVKRLKNREFQPSSSAWERLSSQLNEHTVRKRKQRVRISAAASILLLLGLSTMYFFKSTDTPLPQEILVETKVDKTIKENKELLIDTKQVLPELKEEVVAHNETLKNKDAKIKEAAFEKELKLTTKLKISKDLKEENEVVAQVEKVNDSTKLLPKVKSNSRIQVNSEDLLYAVTHTDEEVKEYYAKHRVNREEVFETIKLELKKSNLSVDPTTILAEIERNLDDEEFKGNFMQKLKVKISDIAVAFAERNK